MTTFLGVLFVAVAGLLSGTGAWPIKMVKRLKFEHWWFAGMLTGLIIIPWATVLVCCPHPFAAYASVPASAFIRANAFGLAWGLANLLYGICLVRVGVALSGSIVAGLGVSVGAILPMIIKGSGKFQDAPDILSKAGLTVIAGVAVMLIGVVLVGLAGLGRDKVQSAGKKPSGGIVFNLILCVISGITSCGFSLSFVYAQGPIVAAMKAAGAADVPANLAVWAGAIAGGALLNVIYPACMISRNRSWGVFLSSPMETVLAALTGVQTIVGAILMGKGMIMLGALGASVGFGIQQAMQMTGNQGLGFISGEWRGVHGKPLKFMITAIAVLILAAMIMAYGNAL